jgi:large subunit ribosomal protein L9
MRVVLLENVPDLGQAGEVKDVADGHARNFLIPRGFAQMATKGAERLWEEQKEAMVRRVATDRQNATEIAAKLSGSTIVVTARAGEQDRLYGSVTGQQIAEAIKEQTEIEIDRHALELEQPIRDLGTFTVTIKLGHAVEAAISVEVQKEEA